MDGYKAQLRRELTQIEKLLRITEKGMKKYQNAPEGRIRVRKCYRSFQYLLKRPGEKEYKYVKKNDEAQLGAMVQRDYYNSLYKKLEKMKRVLESFLANYDFAAIADCYEKLAEGRKKLVKPVIMSDEEYIQKWMDSFKGEEENGFRDNLIFKTERGEMVRSKSEKIIADMLLKYNVPYVYEPCYKRSGKKSLFPDFVTLNRRTRKTVIWEHFGRAGDANYASDKLIRIGDYERDGYMCGSEFIFTVESDVKPLDISLVEKKIQMYLL